MDAQTERKKLAEATALLAATVVEVIEARLKAALEKQAPHVGTSAGAMPHKPNVLSSPEGWVRKKDVAKHLSVSLRTVDNWIRKGYLPHVRLGYRKIFFKLSDVDESLKRRFQRNSPW